MTLFSFFIHKVAAQAPDVVGNVDTTIIWGKSYGGIQGLGNLISNGLRLFFMVAGIIALFNFLLAGFQYMTSGGDSKQLEQAWKRIYLSLIGLVLIVGSFAIAALFGWLIFKDPLFMLRPKIYGPGQ